MCKQLSGYWCWVSNLFPRWPLVCRSSDRTACRGLDATASTFVRVLRQYPLGRLAVFCYVVFVHLFMYLLISRLQHRALTDLSAAQLHLR